MSKEKRINCINYINELIDSEQIRSWKDLYEEIATSGISDYDVAKVIRIIVMNDTAQSVLKSKFKPRKKTNHAKWIKYYLNE